MQNVTKRLIAAEGGSRNHVRHSGRAAFAVCEKLGPPLCTFTGVTGYKSLMSRALVLAQAQAPLLKGIQIKSDGSFEYASEMKTRLATDAGAKAGAVLADQLLGLLVIFIGEALTLRLVHDVWPKAALPFPPTPGK